MRGTQEAHIWFNDLEPYIKNYQVFGCPSSTEGHYDDGDRTKYDHGYYRAGNYGANELVIRGAAYNFPINNNSETTVGAAVIISPASTYMIMDSGYEYLEPYYVKGPSNNNMYLPGEGALGVSDTNISDRFKPDFHSGRHFGGVNVTFADGHTKWLTTKKVYNEAMKLMDEGLSYHPRMSSPALKYSSAWNPWVDNS